MPILTNRKGEDYYQRVRAILNTMKSRDDPTAGYMKRLLKAYTIYYLVENPSVFTSMAAYESFRDKAEPEYRALGGIGSEFDYVQLTELALLASGSSVQSVHRQLYSSNIQTLNPSIQKIQSDKYIPSTTENIVHADNLKHQIAPDMTAQQERILANQIKKLQKLGVEVVHGHTEVLSMLRDQRKLIEFQQRRLKKNVDNQLKLEQMNMRIEHKPRYKVWHYTPNPHTRHSGMEGTTVKLEDKFLAVNEITGDEDYLDYPGEWSGSPSNTYNCMCSISFCNEEDGSKRIR